MNILIGVLGTIALWCVKHMKAIQLVRERILYPGLVKGSNPQPKFSAMDKRTIVPQETSREREKEEIRILFRGNGTLYYSDIVRKLGIGLRTVVEICDELKAAGEIALDERI